MSTKKKPTNENLAAPKKVKAAPTNKKPAEPKGEGEVLPNQSHEATPQGGEATTTSAAPAAPAAEAPAAEAPAEPKKPEPKELTIGSIMATRWYTEDSVAVERQLRKFPVTVVTDKETVSSEEAKKLFDQKREEILEEGWFLCDECALFHARRSLESCLDALAHDLDYNDRVGRHSIADVLRSLTEGVRRTNNFEIFRNRLGSELKKMPNILPLEDQMDMFTIKDGELMFKKPFTIGKADMKTPIGDIIKKLVDDKGE